MIFKKDSTIEFEKQGVKMRVYYTKEKCPNASVVYQETQNVQLKKSAVSEEQKRNKRFFLEKAAAYLHMAVPTLRLHRSKVGGHKIGKRWTFTQEELYRFIEKHRSRVID